MKKLIIVLGAVAVLMLGVLVHLELTKDKQERSVGVTATPTLTPTIEPTKEPIKTVEPTNTPKEPNKPKATQAHTTTEKPSNNATPKPTKKPVETPKATKKPVATPKATQKPVATPKTTKKPVATPKPTKKPVAAPKPTKTPNDNLAKDREKMEKAGFWNIVKFSDGNYGLLVPKFSIENIDKADKMFTDYFDKRNCDVDISCMVGGNWGDSTDRYFFELRKNGIYPR